MVGALKTPVIGYPPEGQTGSTMHTDVREGMDPVSRSEQDKIFTQQGHAYWLILYIVGRCAWMPVASNSGKVRRSYGRGNGSHLCASLGSDMNSSNSFWLVGWSHTSENLPSRK